MHAIAEPPPLIATPLWERARASFARAVAAIGAPAAIAAMALLPPPLRRDIVGWLCVLESIVRKLLLAQAGELKRAEPLQHAPGLTLIPLTGMAQHWTPELDARMRAAAAKRAPQAARAKLDLSRPETWRARFSFSLPRDPLRLPDSRLPRIRPLWGDYVPPPPPPARTPRVADPATLPFRLARRLEALRRVLEDPLPHAERLARVLTREMRRFPEIVQRFAFASSRTNHYDPGDPRLAIVAMARGFAGEPPFSDSS